MRIEKPSRLSDCEEAARHMREALELLDLADATCAAALLDHALHLIPGVAPTTTGSNLD